MVSTAEVVTPQKEQNGKMTTEENEAALPKVQLRNKNKPPTQPVEKEPAAKKSEDMNELAQNALARAMNTIYEPTTELADNDEEIRRLDNQLDHLNEYMAKVEQRLTAHNEKLKQTLQQQREDREKRRRSFHERLEVNRQEDDDFHKQLNSLLNQIVLSKRQSGVDENLPKAE